MTLGGGYHFQKVSGHLLLNKQVDLPRDSIGLEYELK